MITFNSNLRDALRLNNNTTFWCLKLYYNDESAFVGVSDTDRDDGSDFYHGVVTDFGELVQNLDYLSFTTSISNMTIKIANTHNTIQGGRFSDLLSSNNFGNRKWELFQCMNGLTFDSAANQIGTGVISGDFKYNRNEIILELLDKTGSFHNEIPKTEVSNAAAPKTNQNRPIPIAYGDFETKLNAGTIPSNFAIAFPGGRFPAIVDQAWNSSDDKVVARPDSVAIHTLSTSKIYQYKDNVFTAISSSNCAVSTSDPSVKFGGSTQLFYPPAVNDSNLYNGNFSTGRSITASNGSATIGFSLPELKDLGTITGIKLLCSFTSMTSGGSADAFTFRDANNTSDSVNISFADDALEQSITIPLTGGNLIFDVDEQTGFTMEGDYEFFLQKNSGTIQAIFQNVILEFTFTSEQNYLQKLRNIREVEQQEKTLLKQNRKTLVTRKTIVIKDEVEQPASIEYVYCAGKGRKYGSWIEDTGDNDRSNGYEQNDLIENPIYIIEDILRTELNLTNIDDTSFDAAGNTSDGKIINVFDDAATDVKFAFSQYKFIDSQELIDKICRLCGSYVFLSGNGDFKIQTLERPEDYNSSDVVKTIDYNKITLDKIELTPINAVRNKIITNFNFDYGKEESTDTDSIQDTTSQGTGVGGVGEILTLEIDANKIIDSTTIRNLGTYLLATGKDRKITIMFDSPTAIYNGLEIGDMINFENFDSEIKLYGAAMDSTNNIFMITQTSKRPNGCEFLCVEVSD